MMIGLGSTVMYDMAVPTHSTVTIILPEGGWEGKPFEIHVRSVQSRTPVKANFYLNGKYFGTKNYGQTGWGGILIVKGVFGKMDASPQKEWTTEWFIGSEKVLPKVITPESKDGSLQTVTVTYKPDSGAPDGFQFAPNPARSAIDEWIFGDSDPGFGAIYVYGLLGLGAVVLFLMMRGGEKQ
jgi:hypothetical protein